MRLFLEDEIFIIALKNTLVFALITGPVGYLLSFVVAWFINDFLQPIYEMFLMEAVAIGRIEAAGFFEDPRLRAAWLNADWINETNHSLDPLKEAQAIKLRLDSGLSTYRKELAENGGLDFDDVVETLSQERALINTLPPFMPSAEIQHDAESEEVIT